MPSPLRTTPMSLAWIATLLSGGAKAQILTHSVALERLRGRGLAEPELLPELLPEPDKWLMGVFALLVLAGLSWLKRGRKGSDG